MGRVSDESHAESSGIMTRNEKQHIAPSYISRSIVISKARYTLPVYTSRIYG